MITGKPMLVCGAINTDLVAYVDRAPEAGETITGNGFEMHGGGKGANQAVAAARAGAVVVMLGGVGKDAFGDARLAGLMADGISTSYVQVMNDVASGVALITVDASAENRIAYIPSATAHVTSAHCLSAIESIQPAIVLAANELSVECHREIFGWARSNGTPVIFNVAPFAEDARELLPLVDVLIVNEVEAAELLGTSPQRSAQELAMDLGRFGGERCVVTLGSAGALGRDGEHIVHVPRFDVAAVDTTGAGDTFCGAFASAMLDGMPFAESIRFGNAAAALSVTKRGAQPSIPTELETRALLESVDE